MSEFWFCLTHERVEQRDGCRNSDRLGPYDTEQEAARALETARERTESWDNDPDWNDEPPGASSDGEPAT